MTRSIDDLKAELAALPPRAQACFAAACAQRLRPVYRELVTTKKADKYEQLLDAIWDSLDAPLDHRDLVTRRDVKALGPAADNDHPSDPFVMHAAFALGHAGDRNDADAAGWAAEANLEIPWQWRMQHLDGQPIARDPLVYPECVRTLQQLERDLATVQTPAFDPSTLRRLADTDGEAMVEELLRSS